MAMPRGAPCRRPAPLLVLLFAGVFYVLLTERRVLAASVQPAAGKEAQLSHDTGLRELSGKSLRAFKNRVRRQLRGAECLTHHAAGHWWRYEWCVDQHVRQFHVDERRGAKASEAESSSKTETSIQLGSFRAESTRAIRVARVDNFARIADPDVAGYMAIEQYTGAGDYCEAAGRARRVQIQYACCAFRSNETYIERVEETTFGSDNAAAVCDYNVRVCSPAACGLVQRDAYAMNAPMHMARDEQLAFAQTVKDMFYHAYRGYLAHAFPKDDLAPLSCRGADFELGKLPMLTLIDTLDTLALLDDAIEFRRAVSLVVERANFDLDTHVSVFETTIRVLGGLLSSHMLAADSKRAIFPKGEYKGELLALAQDVADRLMPAFDTPTGIPFGTVNLRYGVPKKETPIASTAGAGSLSLEFTMLSVLTGNPKYAVAARGAVRALFDRRSPLGLLGKHINTRTGDWTETSSGPGSNSDSFYEYLLKMYMLFGDREALEMFGTVYPAVLEHNLHGDWYADVSMWTGCRTHQGNQLITESLATFWPGMQVGAGHLHSAANSMNAMYRVWREYGFFPEQFDVRDWRPVRGGGGGARYPLRPELIESTFYMHEATNDSSWLRAGAHFVHSLQKYAKTDCGYASIADVERKQQEDYMPSFFLSETCKYLYLLFNTTHFVREGGYVMTTEAHPFPLLPTKLVAPILEAGDKHTPLHAEHFPDDRTLQCIAPSFSDRIAYSVDYESQVVTRTPRCIASSNAKQREATKQAPTKSMMLTTGFDQWLPAIEAKLRHQFDFLYRNKGDIDGQTVDTSGFGGDDDVITDPSATTAVLLSGDDFIPSRRIITSQNGVERENWLYELLSGSPTPMEMEAETFTHSAPYSGNVLDGGPELGAFEITQREGSMLFTRKKTGDWLEVAGIADALHMLVSMGIAHGDELSANDESHQADSEWLPSLQPTYHVYKVNPDGELLPKSTRCTLHVSVASPTEQDEAIELSYPCAAAGFGLADAVAESHKSPLASLVMAEPRDGCEPLTNARESVKGAMVLVMRGDCFFETKMQYAEASGAAGVVVVNNEEVAHRVMVMGGSGADIFMEDESGYYEGSDGSEANDRETHAAKDSFAVEGEPSSASSDDSENKASVDGAASIPAVMVSRGVGEWLVRSFLSRNDEDVSAITVHASIELEVRDREQRPPVEDVIRRGGRAFPYVDARSSDRMRVFGPEWGVQLVATTAGDAHDSAYMSYAVAILETPRPQHVA